MLFLETSMIIESVERKKISENPAHNILELYIVLLQGQFVTSKTKLNIYYNKPVIRFVLLVAERINT